MPLLSLNPHFNWKIDYMNTSYKGCLCFLILLQTVSVISSAQVKDAYEMRVDGVKVIVQPSGNEIIEVQTIIKGGVQNYPAGKDGIESLAMDALTECGTAKDDKNSFKNKLDKVSARVYGSTGMDFSSFNLNCIKDDFNTVWPLYVDALTTPRFDEKEFARVKQDAINSLKMQASEPDYAISKLARQTAYAGKNYAKIPEGTEATVSKLTAAETKAYYKNILTRSRMVIVIVGELDRQDITNRVTQLLATIPQGAPFTLKKESFLPKENSFISEKKDFATNYIQAVSGAPSPGTTDFNAFLLAMRIFSNRQFIEVRTKNGLSYAPYSYFDAGLSPSANIFVSTTEPNKYISVINDLVSRTKKQGFTEDEVKNMKSTYITQFYYRLETNGAQAASLASNEVLHNNWRRSITINDDLKAITAADLNRVFNKYVTNFAWVYQGDPGKVDPNLYRGTVKKPLPPSKLNTTKKKN
jgi:zinc protease